MKTALWQAIFMVGLGMVGQAAIPATYYVDFDNGNDAAAGTTKETAWKTLPGTRNVANSDWRSSSYGAGVVVRNTVKVAAGTTFKIKSGTRMGAPSLGRLWISSAFYANGTPAQPITMQRDLSWGTGQVVLDAASVVIPSYYGMIAIDSVDCIVFDGAVTNGILVKNSSFNGITLKDAGFNGSQLKNMEIYNSSRANVMVQSLDKSTPTYIGGVILDSLFAHVTRTQDDTSGNIYLGYAENSYIRNCLATDAPTGADGIHVGGGRNIWIVNCITHDNGEQGIDLSRDGDYKARDDMYGITVRNCIGYNNYKDNLDLNSGVHDVYFIGCIAWKTTITARGDGNFHIYQGTRGTNFWINCTSAKGADYGYGFLWNGQLSSVTGAIPPGNYHQYLINCISHADTGNSVLIESDYAGLAYQVHYINSLFSSSRSGVVIQQKTTAYTAADIKSGANGWPGLSCLSTNPLFVSVQDSWLLSNIQLQPTSPCLNGGVFPFRTSGAGNAATIMNLVPVVPGLDARRVFLPGDVIAIAEAGTAIVASVNSATQISLSAAKTWANGGGVWFPWSGVKPAIGATYLTGTRTSSPRAPTHLRSVPTP